MACLLVAAQGDWQKKKPAEWTQEDAHELLTDSPWAKSTTPQFKPQSVSNMGRGGMGVGIGGMGGGMGRRGGGMGRMPREPREERPQQGEGKAVVVRWESALPIQEAELKAKNASAPEMQEGQYAIVIDGLPARRLIQGDRMPKPHGELKREGQKTIKSVDARVLPRDEGPLVIFYFSRTKEIVPGDKQIEFDGEVGPFHVKQAFSLEDMVYQGQLAL